MAASTTNSLYVGGNVLAEEVCIFSMLSHLLQKPITQFDALHIRAEHAS